MNVKPIINTWSPEDLRRQISTILQFSFSQIKEDELQQLMDELKLREKYYHLLGVCHNQACERYGGGDVFPVSVLKHEEANHKCKVCGMKLSFTVHEGGYHDGIQ